MSMCEGCPFNFTELSAKIQNYGCLPEPHEIITLRQNHGKTWACHSNNSKPCVGAIQYMAEKGMPYKVIDPELLTEKSDWASYIDSKIREIRTNELETGSY